MTGIVSINNLRDKLKTLPTSLNDMYTETFDRLQSQGECESSLGLRALLWITYSFEYLTVKQLLVALAIQPEYRKYDPDDCTTREILVSTCCGLITIEEKSDRVRLIRSYSSIILMCLC